MKHKNQESKKYLKNVSDWNYIVGYIFLLLYLLVSFALYKRVDIFGILSSLAFAIVFLNYVIGLLYIITASYLSNVQGKLTKTSLWVTIVISILAITNIIPIVNLVLAIKALSRVPKITVESRQFSMSKFLIFPGNIIGICLVICVFVLFGLTLRSQEVLPVIAANSSNCISKTSTDTCKIHNEKYGFSVTFPGEPTVYNSKAYTGEVDEIDYFFQFDSEDPTNGAGTIAEWLVAPGNSYAITVLDYSKAPNADGGIDPGVASITNDRYTHGVNVVESNTKCEQNAITKDFAFTHDAQVGLFAGLPALVYEKTTNYSEGTCYHRLVSVANGAKTYTILGSSFSNDPQAAKNKISKFFDSFTID